MSVKWLSYVKHVWPRLHMNWSFFKDAWVVAHLFGHYKVGSGKRPNPNKTSRPTIAFFPQPAGPWYNIWLVLQNTDLKIIKEYAAADYVFMFDDSTSSVGAPALPEDVSGKLINHRISDISKSTVAAIFKSIFEYDLEVDPVTYAGDAVEKSEENGTHDGRIVTCPLPANAVKPGYCYQKLIDSTFNGKTSEDLRILCIYGEVAAVFHKHKALPKRFGTEYLSTDVKTAEDVFTSAELALITEFCTEIGLDFGAIDVMRDKHDGRIYIVDVNKTCMPVLSLPYAEQYRAMTMAAQVFERKLEGL